MISDQRTYNGTLPNPVRERMDELVQVFAQGLRDVPAYSQFPLPALQAMAGQDLDIVARLLDTADRQAFVEDIEGMVRQRFAQGIDLSDTLRVLNDLEQIVAPAVEDARSLRLLWMAFSQSRAFVAREASQRLEISERRFRQIVDTAPLGMHFYQLEADGRLVFTGANPAADAILKTEHSQFIGKTIEEAFPGLKDTLIPDIYRRAAASGEPWQTDQVLYDEGQIAGAYEVRAFQAGPGRMVASFLDITERKRAEEALRQAQERSQAVVDAIPDMIFRLDREGVFIDFKAEKGQELLLPPEAFLGKRLEEVMPPNVSAAARESMERAYQSGEAQTFEYELAFPDGVQHFEARMLVSPSKEAIAIIRNVTERKRTEAEMLRGEERFRRMTASMREGLTIIEGTQVVYVNDRLSEIFGYSKDELMKMNSLDFAIPEEKARIAELIDQVRSKNEPLDELTLWVVRKDGERRCIQNYYSTFREGDRIVGRMVVTSDITERKQVEDALRQSENRFRALIENGADAITLLSADGSVIYEGPTVERLTGYKPEDRVGKAGFGNIHPDDLPIVRATLGQVMATPGGSANAIFRSVKKDGTVWWTEGTATNLLNEPSVQAIVINYRDITERKRLEHEQRRLVSIIESSPDFIGVASMDGKGVYLNPAGLAMTGYTAEEFDAGMSIGSLQPDMPEDAIPTAVKEGLWSGEAQLTHKDGRRIPVSQVINVIKDDAGNPLGFSTTARDISERKQAEDALQASEQRFRTFFERTAEAYLILEDSMFVDCNQAAVEMLGASSREEVTNTHPSHLSPEFQPDGRPSAEKADEMIQIALERGSHRFEWVHRRVDGIDFPVEVLLTSVSVGGRTILLSGWREIAERKRLEQQLQSDLERRGYQVRVSTQIAQEIAAAPDLRVIFDRVVTLVKEQFGYYHTQILRYEPALDAVLLIAGYGEIGRQMLAVSHQLPMGIGLIGTAAATGETVMRPALRNDPDWKPHPLLPDTRGEIAVPIKLRDQVLGVLDVQSDREGALSEDDRLLLEGLCGQIALAIEDTRLRQETEQRLRELDRLYRFTSRETWQDFRQAQGRALDYYFDQLGVQAAEKLEDVGPLAQVDATGFSSWNVGEEVVTVPMALRGEVIGVLGIQDNPQKKLLPEDLSLVEAITDQVVLALESARLFERTQSALAETETLYGIIAEMNAAQSYDDILRALAERTILRDAETLFMGIFDQPMSAGEKADGSPGNGQATEWIYPVAVRGGYAVEIAPRYPVSAFQSTPNTLFTNEPVVLQSLSTDRRLDTVTRTLFQEVFLAESSIIIPFMLGDQSIGFVQGFFCQPVQIPQTEIQRLSAVAGQAAIAVQSRLLLEQAQSRARQEQRIREVTSQVFSATDVDTIMRRAVEQVGRVLGMPAYIYLSQSDDQSAQPKPGDGYE